MIGYMPTKDGVQGNYVKRFMVLSRVDGCRDLGEAPVWEDAGMFENNRGGNERQEHRFKRPRDARYVKIVGRLIQCVFRCPNMSAVVIGLTLQIRL